ncbi:hypothetical protein MLD38_010483 [Melastoma candidum]|uniref:Uncharacterized protein n=1 Tax=Melastoma candidum TaxID=119954 RepID=A0ACB9R1A3_9MYRT|nr:hypothetical protein MLD38_010483 [Melastoma candidum]
MINQKLHKLANLVDEVWICLFFHDTNGGHIYDGRELVRATVAHAFALLVLRDVLRTRLETANRALSLSLRFSALVLGFVSAVTLTTRSGKRDGSLSSFTDSSELVYCLIVSIVTFVYSALQLFKGVCDISYGTILIPDRISDYLSFVLDQMLAYLLISSSALGLQAIQQTDSTPSLQRAAIVSVTNVIRSFLGHGCLHTIVWLQALQKDHLVIIPFTSP